MTELKFFRGTKDSYNINEHGAGIYFTTDTNEIIHNDKSYSGLTSEQSGISNIQQTESNSIEIKFANGETKEISSGIYQSNLDENVTINGINVGELNGKSYDEILDRLLFPTVNPTVIAEPSIAGFTLYTQTNLVEQDSPVIKVTDAALNKGSWSDGTSYAGNRVARTYYFNGVKLNTLTEYEEQTYQLGDNNYTVVITYEEGEQPKNNKGELIEDRCPSGEASATRIVNATLPWYIGNVKQELIPWTELMETGVFELAPHTQESPQSFSLPRQAISIYTFNSISSQNDGAGIGFIKDNSAWEEIENNGYYTYSYKGSNRGSVKMIVKF